jgi:AraC-like DNA-binding protein
MPTTGAPPPGFIAPSIRRGRYLFLDPTRRGDLRLVCAGWEECGSDFVIDRPSFSWHAVELLATGAWQIHTGSRWLAAPAGTILGYGPSQPGGIRAVGPGPHEKYFADFRARRPGSLLAAAGLRAPRHRRLGDKTAAAACYRQILDCAGLPLRHRAHLADLLLEVLLARLAVEPKPGRRTAAHPPETFIRCRDYLLAHYPEVRGLAEAARHCHVTPEYFSRLFRRHAGQTAARFLAGLRANHAAKLLLRSNITVKAAAHAVGFDDPYHFSRVFKRIHGQSPRHFARQDD